MTNGLGKHDDKATAKAKDVSQQDRNAGENKKSDSSEKATDKNSQIQSALNVYARQ